MKSKILQLVAFSIFCQPLLAQQFVLDESGVKLAETFVVGPTLKGLSEPPKTPERWRVVGSWPEVFRSLQIKISDRGKAFSREMGEVYSRKDERYAALAKFESDLDRIVTDSCTEEQLESLDVHRVIAGCSLYGLFILEDARARGLAGIDSENLGTQLRELREKGIDQIKSHIADRELVRITEMISSKKMDRLSELLGENELRNLLRNACFRLGYKDHLTDPIRWIIGGEAAKVPSELKDIAEWVTKEFRSIEQEKADMIAVIEATGRSLSSPEFQVIVAVQQESIEALGKELSSRLMSSPQEIKDAMVSGYLKFMLPHFGSRIFADPSASEVLFGKSILSKDRLEQFIDSEMRADIEYVKAALLKMQREASQIRHNREPIFKVLVELAGE
jgi:hypothetical protein